jgi:hypothetical protein
MGKRKLASLLFCLTAVVFLFSSCTTVKEKPEDTKETYVAPTKGLGNCKNPEDAGKKMIDSILEGLSTGNYALYSRDFTEKNKKYFDRSIFDKAHEAVKENLGKYEGIKYIGFWKKGDYDILLWKGRFSDIKDDILVKMYVKKADDTYKIAALKLI